MASHPVGLSDFPDYVTVQGLLCIRANVNDASNTIRDLSLCRFYRKEVTAFDGQIYCQLREPKRSLKITLNEAKALKVKLDYMIEAAKAINEDTSMISDSVAVAKAIRRKEVEDHVNQSINRVCEQGRETPDPDETF